MLHHRVHLTVLAFALATTTACAIDDEASEEQEFLEVTAAIEVGVPVTGISGSRGNDRRYELVIPAGAGALTIRTSGGSGNADLYARFGQRPTTSTHDQASRGSTNDEVVTVAAPRAGTYHLLVRAVRPFGDVTLLATLAASPDAGAPDAGAPDAGVADAAPGGLDCRNPATWPAEWTAYEDEVLARINQQRAAGATCGTTVRPPVGPLVMNAELREAVRCHSLDMGTRGYFSHVTPEGIDPWQRIAQAGYTASPTGENIAAGYATPAAAVQGWVSSEGHCNNLMNGNSNESGIGFASVPGSPYRVYWTQALGRRR
jgi:uncharacterized protein YkwD